MSKLMVELKVGQSLKVGDAVVTLEKKSGQVARLVVTAPADVEIRKPQKPANGNDNFH